MMEDSASVPKSCCVSQTKILLQEQPDEEEEDNGCCGCECGRPEDSVVNDDEDNDDAHEAMTMASSIATPSQATDPHQHQESSKMNLGGEEETEEANEKDDEQEKKEKRREQGRKRAETFRKTHKHIWVHREQFQTVRDLLKCSPSMKDTHVISLAMSKLVEYEKIKSGVMAKRKSENEQSGGGGKESEIGLFDYFLKQVEAVTVNAEMLSPYVVGEANGEMGASNEGLIFVDAADEIKKKRKLNFCQCRKTRCKSKSCNCWETGCTEKCKCKGCGNDKKQKQEAKD